MKLYQSALVVLTVVASIVVIVDVVVAVVGFFAVIVAADIAVVPHNSDQCRTGGGYKFFQILRKPTIFEP